MRIAVLGAGHIGSTVGRLWPAAGHEVIFAGRDEGEPRELADAVAGADVVLVAVPGTAVTGVLTAAGRLDSRAFSPTRTIACPAGCCSSPAMSRRSRPSPS